MRKAKITLAIAAVLIITGFTWLAVHSGTTAKSLEVKTLKLESTEKKLDNVNLEVEKLKNKSSEDKAKREQLEKEKADLEAQVHAKAEAKKQLEIAAAEAKSKISATQTASAAPAPARVITGDKHSWLAASGIPQSDWGHVDSIVQRESGWNPNAVNKSSGACGLGQQLPCGKWAGEWNDPVAALVAQHGYVKERYGSYAGAVAFWNTNKWY